MLLSHDTMSVRGRRPVLLLAACLFCMALAPDDPLEDALADPTETAAPAASAMWCGIADPASSRYFVTDVFRPTRDSHMAMWSYESRFASTVNGSYRAGLRNGSGACHVSAAKGSASMSRSAAIRRMSVQRFAIINLGVF